ncbi:MAG: hypothetical protein H6R34_485, partial [Bacteroidetes bacterium]|nr:hypothetical protein [Bacteroidota bacterium]
VTEKDDRIIFKLGNIPGEEGVLRFLSGNNLNHIRIVRNQFNPG